MAARRVPQAVAAVVVHHVDRALVVVHVAAARPGRRAGPVAAVVVHHDRAVMHHPHRRTHVPAVVAPVVAARLAMVAVIAPVVPAPVVVALAMVAATVGVGQGRGRRRDGGDGEEQGGAPLQSWIHVCLRDPDRPADGRLGPDYLGTRLNGGSPQRPFRHAGITRV